MFVSVVLGAYVVVFIAVIYRWAKLAKMFMHGNPLQPMEYLPVSPKAHPKGGAPKVV
jgi:hypothetical protein